MKLVGRVPLADLAHHAMVRLEYPPYDVLVSLVDGVPRAIEDACNHAGASLSEGERAGRGVACPMHGYVFDLASGVLLRPKGLCGDQRTFTTEVDRDHVLVWDVPTTQLVTLTHKT